LYFSSGLDEQSRTLVVIIYLYQKARQRFRAEDFQIPQHRKALFVRHNAAETPQKANI
jgi:hypothetical protein